MSDKRAIGVFDSGLGGLSVLRAIHAHLPNESTVYFGDTARLPYGTKTPETIKRYALECAKTLLEKHPIKVLIVACGTVTAVALEDLQKALPIPVIGVIEASTYFAHAHAQSKAIGVLATPATVNSKAYTAALIAQGHQAEIHERACPLFVPIVEEGIIEGPIAVHTAELYLNQLPCNIDTVILGCTHYPLLMPLLKQLRPKTHFIDPGPCVAERLKELLTAQDQLARPSESVTRRYLVTERPTRFEQLSEYFLGNPITSVQAELIHMG